MGDYDPLKAIEALNLQIKSWKNNLETVKTDKLADVEFVKFADALGNNYGLIGGPNYEISKKILKNNQIYPEGTNKFDNYSPSHYTVSEYIPLRTGQNGYGILLTSKLAKGQPQFYALLAKLSSERLETEDTTPVDIIEIAQDKISEFMRILESTMNEITSTK